MTTLEEAVMSQPMTTGHMVTWFDIAMLFAVLATIIAVQYAIMRWREKHASDV